jgi:hypothetical protein
MLLEVTESISAATPSDFAVPLPLNRFATAGRIGKMRPLLLASRLAWCANWDWVRGQPRGSAALP